jgi:hypothetical protein
MQRLFYSILLISIVLFLLISCKKVDRNYIVGGGLFFSSTPVTWARVNDPYAYNADATGVPGATITYALLQFPAGMTMDATTGEIAWTASATQLGSHAVEILASASTGATALQSYNLSAGYNSPPVIASTPVTTAVYGVPYSYTLFAWDRDGDSITYSLVSAPSGMSIGSDSGQITWMPLGGDTFDVTALASDGWGGSDYQSFQIVVPGWSLNALENNAICTAPSNQDSPQLVSDGSGGAIITWRDSRSGTNLDIYAQKVRPDGSLGPEHGSHRAFGLAELRA